MTLAFEMKKEVFFCRKIFRSNHLSLSCARLQIMGKINFFSTNEIDEVIKQMIAAIIFKYIFETEGSSYLGKLKMT